MKKLLPFVVAILFATNFSFAQKQNLLKPKIKTGHVKSEICRQTMSTVIPVKSANELWSIGVSRGIGHVQLNWSKCLAYDPLSDAYMFTHNPDPDIFPYPGLAVSISDDGGMGWNSQMISGFSSIYYPSGVIYNPYNSNDIGSCLGFFVHSSFSGNCYTMARLDNSGQIFVECIDSLLVANGLYVTLDNRFHALALNSSFPNHLLNIVNADINLLDFNYTIEVQDLDIDSYLGTSGFWVNDGTMAWNNDGSVGYVFVNGVTEGNVEITGIQPIVFKSVDSGESWTHIPIENLVDNPGFLPYLTPNWQGVTIPYFTNEFGGEVDIHGDLQLFAEVESGLSHHIDSIALYDPELSSHIFNLCIGDEGVKSIIWCDSLVSNPVPGDSEVAYVGQVGWDHRIQTSRSEDGSVVFVIWTDSDPTQASNGENSRPNLFGWGKTASDYILGKKSFTAEWGDEISGHLLFTLTSPVAKTIDYGDSIRWDIGVTKTLSQVEYLVNTNITDPVSNTFIQGIGFSSLDLGDNDNLENRDAIYVSQNYPNPFSEQSRIEVVLDKNSGFSLEIHDLSGRIVYSRDYRAAKPGKHLIGIKASDFNPGVYFYTVKAGTFETTMKLIVL
jgi:hypothetical protein